jgi:hypothetical protein
VSLRFYTKSCQSVLPVLMRECDEKRDYRRDRDDNLANLESGLVLLRIQGLGFKDQTLWLFFAGERKSGSSRQGFESLLQCKKHPKLPGISQIWATFSTIFVVAVFSAFLRVYLFGVNCSYYNRSFFVEFGDSDLKDPDRIQILFLELAERFGNLDP